MNTSKVIQDSIKEENNPYEESRFNLIETTDRIISSISELKKFKAYLDFKDLVLTPSISLCQKNIEIARKELIKPKSDVQEVMKNLLMNESMLTAFRKFSDLDELEKIFKTEIIRLKGNQGR